MKRVMYFIAGSTPTPSEQAEIDAINAQQFELLIRTASQSNSYGSRAETTDYVAGTVPSSHTGKTVFVGVSASPSIPGVPTIGVASAGNGTVSITFTPPASNGGSAITQYRAKLSTGAEVIGASSPLNFTDVANGVAVTVTVRAENAIGPSAYSSSSNSATPNASATVPGAPTIGTSTASYNDTQGNIFSVTFTPPASDGGATITSYTATLSTGETVTGVSSPLVFVNTLSNGVARTATVKATNGVGQGPASAASNSATPIALLRGVVAQNRTYYTEESRTKLCTADLRGVIVGSGAIKDFAPMVHGWYESYISNMTNCSGAYTINEMSVYSGANTPVAVTWSGATSKVINPGDTEIIADMITAAQLLGGGASEIPQGTTIWIKFRITLASTASGALCTGDLVSDFPGSQHAFYDPAATTLTNTSATQGAWTATGTALETGRPAGMVPQIVGHFVNGDPATFMAIGDSILASSNHDEVSKTTGRGWFANLMVKADSSVIASMNTSVANDFIEKVYLNTKLHALSKYNRYVIDEIGTNSIAQQGTGNPAVLINYSKTMWANLKSNSAGGACKIIRTLLTPRSETSGPSKVMNSAPNTGWGVGEKAAQMHALWATALAGGFIDYLIASSSVRGGTDPSAVEYWLWAGGTGTNLTTDGLHMKNAGVVAHVTDYRPLINSLL